MTINDIEDVFGKDKYPENGFPLEERPSEWEYVYDGLRGKDWHDLVIEDLDTLGGVLEGVECLSPDTFVYFLPGIINLFLNDTSARRCIVDGIAHQLTFPERQFRSKARGHKLKREQKKWEREQGRISQESLAQTQSVLALLSPRQKQFLIKFLQDAAQQDSTMYPVAVNSAIRNLEQGKVEPYRLG